MNLPSNTSAPSRKRLLGRIVRGERGLGLVEVMVAVLILSFGVLATVSAFGSFKRSTTASQRSQVILRVAQQELQKMQANPYSQLVLSAEPATCAGIQPCNRVLPAAGCAGVAKLKLSSVAHCNFQSERLVIAGADGILPGFCDPPSPCVSSAHVNVPVQSGTAPIQVDVYRYVTWRNELCASAAITCGQNDTPTANTDTKRLVVAAVLDPVNNSAAALRTGPRNPIWASTVKIDPKAF